LAPKIHYYFQFVVNHRKGEKKLRQEYVTDKGCVVRGRKFKQLGECRFNCKERSADEDRGNIL
jgi:hypothetical protein